MVGLFCSGVSGRLRTKDIVKTLITRIHYEPYFKDIFCGMYLWARLPAMPPRDHLLARPDLERSTSSSLFVEETCDSTPPLFPLFSEL